jgi:glycosyltransferase involved in cell wall biosynthesis
MLKISIITVCYNAKNTIKQTLDSLFLQDYQNIEFILIDGNSNDGTLDIVKSYESKFDIIISENDNGMYDALNKGIRVANGDIIGILNADDVFCNKNILSLIANIFNGDSELSAIIGDVAFVNESNKIIRYCSARKWDVSKFKFGNMPPHPSFYCRKSYYNKLGYYNTSFKIAKSFALLPFITLMTSSTVTCGIESSQQS